MSRLCLWTHEINDMLCEVWIEFAVATWGSASSIRSHADMFVEGSRQLMGTDSTNWSREV